MEEQFNTLEKRMYSLGLYQLMGIQKGIQAGHSDNEYIIKYYGDEDLNDYLHNWKTVILLNGGTTITLTEHLKTLEENGVKCAAFYEPDLGGIITSISFLLDAEVFDKENEPLFLRPFFRRFKPTEFQQMENSIFFELDDIQKEEYYALKDKIGVKKMFLKFFTDKFSLASN